ncbi:MAG: alpha/beta hydrolase [Solirubrobacterales bacterium]
MRRTILTFALVLCTLPVLAGTARAAADPYVLKRDVPYTGPSGQPGKNLLDVYMPTRPQAERAPVLIWVHGGGWYQGNKSSAVLPKARRFTKAGFVFVSVNYRLSPRADGPDNLAPDRIMFPAQPRDVARATGWVNRNIRRFGGDRSRIVLMGHSAGGQIVSLLATRPGFLATAGVERRQIRGVISLDSVDFNVANLTEPASPYWTDDQKVSFWNAFGTPKENRVLDRWSLASPLPYADRRDPRFFFVVPDRARERVIGARRMARRIGQDHNSTLREVSKTHRQVNRHFGIPAGRGMTVRAMRFARAATSRAKAG